MINHLMYPDDLVLLSPSATGLRELCKNRATLRVGLPSPSFAVNDIAIGEVAKVKYLGHVITNDMTDDADMMRQIRQLYALGNVLSRRFHMCSIEVKNTQFVSLVLYTNV